MITRLLKYSLLTGLALALALPVVAHSQHRAREQRSAAVGLHPAGRYPAGSGLAGHALARAEQIGLSAAQREQISDARRRYLEETINRRATTELARLELRELSETGAPDLAAIETKLREVSEHRIAQLTGALRLNATVTEILSAEQIESLEALRPRNARVAADHRDGRGRRGALGNPDRRGQRGPAGDGDLRQGRAGPR